MVRNVNHVFPWLAAARGPGGHVERFSVSHRRAKLNTARWARTRRAVFARDDYRCRNCGRASRLECDHVRPLWQHPYALEGLQALCVTCHVAKTTAERPQPVVPESVAASRGRTTRQTVARATRWYGVIRKPCNLGLGRQFLVHPSSPAGQQSTERATA